MWWKMQVGKPKWIGSEWIWELSLTVRRLLPCFADLVLRLRMQKRGRRRHKTR